MTPLVYVYNTYTGGGFAVRKKLTITVDEQVYDGLHEVVGRHRISRFIEELVRPHVVAADLDAAYRAMAQDEAREAEALEWGEATIGDMSDETG
jgi:predicted CopG family antitoxin